jgi:dienelactone hydrolase
VRIEGGPRPLYGILSLPARHEPAPLVVLAHGFKGFMEWGFFPSLADLLTGRGIATLRFGFSGNGMRPGDDLVTDLESFRRNTFSREVEDLLAVVTHGPALAPERIDDARVGVLGHSRGGGMAVLAASRDEGRRRIRALVTWNAIGTVDRLPAEEVARWRLEGTYWVENARTGQRLPLGTELLDDVERHRGELDVARAAASREAPWLIVHGADDETVPVGEARALAAVARDPVELAVVAGGGHTFGATHPFHGPTPPLVEAMNRSQAWFRRWLKAD